MLLTIIGLALLFIILVNVVLFCLETEAVGIIISIIGILGFLGGGYLYGVIVVIVGIYLYNHAKKTNEKAEKERSKKYFQQEMYKLAEQCWNSQTYDFNWRLWFDNKQLRQSFRALEKPKSICSICTLVPYTDKTNT